MLVLMVLTDLCQTPQPQQMTATPSLESAPPPHTAHTRSPCRYSDE